MLIVETLAVEPVEIKNIVQRVSGQGVSALCGTLQVMWSGFLPLGLVRAVGLESHCQPMPVLSVPSPSPPRTVTRCSEPSLRAFLHQSGLSPRWEQKKNQHVLFRFDTLTTNQGQTVSAWLPLFHETLPLPGPSPARFPSPRPQWHSPSQAQRQTVTASPPTCVSPTSLSFPALDASSRSRGIPRSGPWRQNFST